MAQDPQTLMYPLACRNTVFKDMVERDRRHVNVHISQEGAAGWWQHCRQPAAIALSLSVLVLLLSTPLPIM